MRLRSCAYFFALSTLPMSPEFMVAGVLSLCPVNETHRTRSRTVWCQRYESRRRETSKAAALLRRIYHSTRPPTLSTVITHVGEIAPSRQAESFARDTPLAYTAGDGL